MLNDLSSWGSDTPPPKTKKVLSKVVLKEKKKPVPKKRVKKKQPEPETMDLAIFSDDDEEDFEDIPLDEQIRIEARKKKAEMIIKEETAKQKQMETAVKRGQLLREDLFFDSITPFIDHLMSDLDRIGSSFLTDIGKLIVEAGQVTPAIRSKWEDIILEKKDDSVKSAVKILEEIKKEQAEG